MRVLPGPAQLLHPAGSAPAPSWVFPFNQPAPPPEDGNQALAVNTTDGSVAYDVAFALVWADDGEPVDTTNEAYAFASCADCAAVAVGFQVVLIVGQADVIVPENLSAAANYNCLRCLTYALASQLVLTLDGPLSEGGTARLNALWAEIAEFGRNLQNIPLSEIQERLNTFKEQIMQIIKATPAPPRPGPRTRPGQPHRPRDGGPRRRRHAAGRPPGATPGHRRRRHRRHPPAARSGPGTRQPARNTGTPGRRPPSRPAVTRRRRRSRRRLRRPWRGAGPARADRPRPYPPPADTLGGTRTALI